jgi:fibronectin type 3 domain-containing protein
LYTIYTYVSAYRASDGGAVFLTQANGYASPPTVSVSANDTIYVRVESQGGWSGTYAIRYYDPAGLPPQVAPSNAVVRANPHPACVITWNSLAGVTGYKVYRSTISGTYTDPAVWSGTSTSYTDTAVTAGTRYYYKVCAVNAHGEGILSAELSDIPPAAGTVPALTPNSWTSGDLAAGAVHWYKFDADAGVSYRVQWDDRYNSSGSYTIYTYVSAYRASDGGAVFSGSVGGYTSPPTVSVSANDTIYVRVESQDGYPGPYAVRYYNPAGLPPQAAPPNAAVRANPKPVCVITWNSVADATGYKVYRSTASGTYTDPEVWSGTSRSYTDTAVTAGTRYYYKVSATNAHGEGILSAEVSDTPPAAESVTALTHNTWTDGTLAAGDVHWYKFDASAGVSCRIQWDDSYQGSGTYSCDVKVSAYRDSDGTAVFSSADSGYASPRTVSVSASDTIYVRVEGYGLSNSGTYAVRYYQQ